MYDTYATVQKAVAENLMTYLPSGDVGRILEIGCGTGIYTGFLREKFKDAYIKACDMSGKSIEIARSKFPTVDFVVCDAEDAQAGGKYNLITANGVFQWFKDLESAIKKYRTVLSDEGSLVFSVFGPGTFKELDQCLTVVSDRHISSYYFAGKERLDGILRTSFTAVETREMLIREEYLTLGELLNKIRYTGVRGDGAGGRFLWGRDRMNEVERIYRERFGRITVSYQIFICKVSI